MRLSDLLSLEVRIESGEKLGRVHDVRGELTSRSLKVTALVAGKVGLLERLGVGAPESADRVRPRDTIPWSAVVRVDRGGVVVKDGTTLK
jgi:sporulation protein YlmC with PRC-barrel domain